MVILVADLKELLSYLGFTLSLSAALTVASVFVLARREGSRFRPMPGHPVVPAVYVAATVGLAALAGLRQPAQLAAAVVTIASGWGAWLLLRRPGAPASRDAGARKETAP